MNENTIAETLKGFGITDEAGLINFLKDAKEKSQASDGALDVIKDALLAQNETMKKLFEDKNEREGAVLDELEAKGLEKAFKDADENGRDKIWDDTIAKYGTEYGDTIALAVEGNSFKKLMNGPNPKSGKTHELKSQLREVHDLVLTIAAMSGGIHSTKSLYEKDLAKVDKTILAKTVELLVEQGVEYADVYQKAAADAWDTETNGDGAEWLPINLSADLVERIYLPLTVVPIFGRFTMTSKTMRRPRLTGRARAGLMGEAKLSTDLLTNMAPFSMEDSTDLTWTARKLGISQMFSDEIEQDAIVPTGQAVLKSVVGALGASLEDATLNGSKDLFNDLDNAVGGSELYTTSALAFGRDMWDGIRKGMVAGVKTNSGGTLTTAQLRTARKTMGRYGVDPNKLVWVISPNSLAEFLGLAEVITMEKFGPNATIVKGQLGKIDGIDIIISEYVYTNLAATGVYTGAGNTKTAAYLIYKDAWEYGDRRLVRIEQDRQITSQQNVVVGTWRGDFRKLYGSELTEAQIYNLSA